MSESERAISALPTGSRKQSKETVEKEGFGLMPFKINLTLQIQKTAKTGGFGKVSVCVLKVEIPW
jgi:hypothetical protein